MHVRNRKVCLMAKANDYNYFTRDFLKIAALTFYNRRNYGRVVITHQSPFAIHKGSQVILMGRNFIGKDPIAHIIFPLHCDG